MIKRKLRYAFALFFVVTIASGLGGVLYLQSEGFANSVKRMISERSGQNLGVVGDFKNLKLYFFPPGVGIAEPTLQVKKENIAKIPVEAKIDAKELRVSFAPIQMFSGTLQVEELKVVGGSIVGSLGKEVFKAEKKPTHAGNKIHWNDLFKLQINGISLEDTYLHLDFENPEGGVAPISTEFVVKNLDLKKAEVNQRPGFVSQAIVSAVKVDVPKKILDLPIKEAYQVQWNVQWNDEGIRFSPLNVDVEGLNLKLNGKIAGNLLDEAGDLKLEAEAQVSSNLSAFASNQLDNDDLSGYIQASAKVTAKLRDLEHTLKATYQITGKDLAWKEVKVSRLHSDGIVNLPTKQIELKNLTLLSPEMGVQQKMEGELLVEDASIPIGFDQPFDAKLKLKHADMHWLGGVVLKQIFLLEGQVSGEFKTKFIPGRTSDRKNWKLLADASLEVEHFGLTNQKYQIPKPKKYILKPPRPVKVNGEFTINAQGVDFPKATVQIEKTKFDVVGAVHPNAEGLKIVGVGPLDLKEIDQIAENPIRGTGNIKVDVHGPLDNFFIDFDADLKDAEYLDLVLGDVKGLVTYDDDISEIRLKGIRARQRGTFYSLDEGYIDLSGADEIHLPIVVHSGRVDDIALILGSIIKKIDWYPKSLVGEVHGDVEIGGKMDLPLLEITSHLEGSDWGWLQEKVRKVKFNFGYDRGRYYASNVNLTKTNGQVLGAISFNSNTDEIEWNFKTENFTLNDIDFVDRLEVPARSRIDIKSAGKGKMSQIQSVTEGKMYDTVLKGERLDPTVVVMEMGEKTFRLKLDVFGNRLHSQLKYAFTPKQPSQFSLDLNDFDFSPVLVILNPKLMDDPELKAKVAGHIHLDFLSTQSELARGSVSIDQYLLKKTDFYLKLADPVEVPVQLGFFTLPPTQFQFKNAEFKISGEGNRGNVDIALTGGVDLAIAEFFSSSIQKIQGTAETSIRLHGPMKDLSVTGDANFEGAYALMRWMQTPFEEIDGSIRLRQGVIYIESVESYLADEAFYLNGTISTFTDRFPKMDIKAQFEDNKVKLLPMDYVQVRGTTSIHGDAPPYLISGNLEVLQALWTKSFADAGGVIVRGERFAPTQNQNQNKTSNSLFNLDLNVTANQSVFVRNDLMDAEFHGKVKLIGPPDNPKMLGEAQLVQGKILFRDRPFNLESVKVTLDDPLQFSPKYSATAVSDYGQYKIRLLASGRGSQVKAEFSSTPFLPESEINSLLTSGMTTTDTSRFRSTKDRTYVNQGEAASLILHSMDFGQDVQRKTGFQFDVEEAVDQQTANSVFRPTSTTENVASPKIVLKRNLGQNINMSFGSTVGVGTETIREANAEYKLTPGASLIGVWNEIEGIEGVNTQQTRTSFGLDVRLNKKFK